jgi:SP family xylose:H+ symportor-like MFS transporter
MFFSGAIPAAIFLILLFFVPETPRYLVMKGQNDKALKVLKKLQEKRCPKIGNKKHP